MAGTLLGIVGSPRKYGNSELFIKELYRRMEGEWSLELLRLPELDVKPCLACYQCLFDEMKCPQKDDFPLALEALARSDAYVVAAPTYLLGANAGLKRFLDRGLSFYGELDRLWGKPAVGVAIAGIDGMEGAAKLNVDSFIKLTMGDLRGSTVIYAALPGEILLGGGGREAAGRLAKALTGEKPGPVPGGEEVPVCNTCGGDTFRFLPGGGIRCMMCSGSGEYSWEGGRLRVRTSPGDHPLFLSYESVKRHLEWLRGMKDEFLARRKELKAATQGFAGVGTWIRPGKEVE